MHRLGFCVPQQVANARCSDWFRDCAVLQSPKRKRRAEVRRIIDRCTDWDFASLSRSLTLAALIGFAIVLSFRALSVSAGRRDAESLIDAPTGIRVSTQVADARCSDWIRTFVNDENQPTRIGWFLVGPLAIALGLSVQTILLLGVGSSENGLRRCR
jgi:hypothetical protein